MAHASQQINPSDAETTLQISRVFKASREKVYNAWVDPKALAQWWGPEGHTATIDVLEVKPGGTYRTAMTSPEGVEMWVGGTFNEVSANEKLVFTWAWEDAEKPGQSGHETRVTIAFQDAAGGTEVTLTHELFENVEQRNMHEMGWSSTFVCLANVVGG